MWGMQSTELLSRNLRLLFSRSAITPIKWQALRWPQTASFPRRCRGQDEGNMCTIKTKVILEGGSYSNSTWVCSKFNRGKTKLWNLCGKHSILQGSDCHQSNCSYGEPDWEHTNRTANLHPTLMVNDSATAQDEWCYSTVCPPHTHDFTFLK